MKKCETGAYIVCFGAGETAKSILPKTALFSYVNCFVDNNSTLWGKSFKIGSEIYKIFPPSYLQDAPNVIVLITAGDYLSIEEQLRDSDNIVLSWQRRSLTDEEFFDNRVAMTCIRIEQEREYLIVKNRATRDASYWRRRKEHLLSGEILVVPQVIFILSTCCTLKCEYCSMLMPRFSDAWEIDADEAIVYIDNFLRGVDEVISFNLIGGEPLLYEKLYLIIEHLQREDKVKTIALATNCTVMPNGKNLEALRGDKIEVALSDYGNLEKLTAIIELFGKQRINFKVLSDMQWIDFGGTEYRGKDANTLRYEYCRCFISDTCKALYKNMYFSCERAARMHMLGNIYDAGDDCVVLKQDAPDEDVRAQIKAMLRRTSANACNYCDAGSDDAKEISAGKQI